MLITVKVLNVIQTMKLYTILQHVKIKFLSEIVFQDSDLFIYFACRMNVVDVDK